MTSDKKPDGESPNGTSGATAGPEATAAAAAPATQAAEVPGPSPAADVPGAGNDELVRLKAEAADLKDRLLRAHAEMDNVRKRLEREKADTAKFAITRFARDMVGVGDNVQRAIDAVPHRSVELDPALKSFVDGVTMIERELLTVLERHGVKRLDPKGEPFNPHLHQAVMEMPAPEVPSGTVTQVFQAGYMIEERVLRPAMVAVARGGMKPAAAPADAAPAANAAAATAGNGSGGAKPGEG